MVGCETIVNFLVNPWTYAALISAGTILGVLYRYSSFTFLPRLVTVMRLSSVVNFAWNLVKSAHRYNLFRYLAVYTTFSTTIRTGLTGGTTQQILASLGNELFNKIVLAAKNLVDGVSVLGKWLATSNTFCGLYSNKAVLGEAVVLLWTGVAAYIFVLWVWQKLFYDWRGRNMEQQNTLLVVGMVTALSLAVYGLSLGDRAVENTVSLLRTLGWEGVQEGLNQSTSNATN